MSLANKCDQRSCHHLSLHLMVASSPNAKVVVLLDHEAHRSATQAHSHVMHWGLVYEGKSKITLDNYFSFRLYVLPKVIHSDTWLTMHKNLLHALTGED